MKSFSSLHRSLRFVANGGLSIAFSMLTALALSFLVMHYGSRVLGIHQELVRRILLRVGIPLAGSVAVAMPGNFDVPTPLLNLATYTHRTGLMAVTAIVVAAIGAAIYFRVTIGRLLILLQFSLLAASLLNILLGGSGFGTDSGLFAALWLRFEFVVWILLPFIMALFVWILLPSGGAFLFWMVMPSVYAILWSAVRLAFCLGILQLTGPLLAPLLWFTLGALADLLYISVFYSVIVYHANLLRGAEAA